MFTDQLEPTTSSGQPVSFLTLASNANLIVSSTGAVVTTGGPLSVGSYSVSGTDDNGAGDVGNWSYTLAVTEDTIVQGAPLSGAVSNTNSAAFTAQLTPTAFNGSPVVFTTVSNPTPGVTISSSGGVSTTGALAANTYTVSGTDANGIGDTGTWSYSLTVSGATIPQGPPLNGTVTSSASATFTAQLTPTAFNGSPVVFTTVSNPTPGVTISSSGGVSTTGALAANTYTVSGTDANGIGDTGTWAYTLTVNPNPVTTAPLRQSSPTTGVTTTVASGSFKPGPLTVSNGVGAVTFVATSTSAGLSIAGNQISITGSLKIGRYTISGSDHDTSGNTGTWTYTLTVTNDIAQTSPTTGTTTTRASATFVPGTIIVTNNAGQVTFVTTVSSTGLHVTGSGVVTTTRRLVAGSYKVAGTDSDTSGNTGTWAYTLVVNNPATTVTFYANSGKGTMKPERQNAASPLSVNRFTRTGYTFTTWNTAANGSGVSYANGASYSFTKSTTLYAQWKRGRVLTRSVTFNANGGTGAMKTEHDNTPSALAANSFTRTGYTFTTWNTAANGSGVNYLNTETYSFRVSVTLYARWKIAKPKANTVVFSANGGRGTMASERHAAPKALSHNRFRRAGYIFARWNTAANGSGASYANGAMYPFTTSTTLFAQWHLAPVPKPPVNAVVTVGPFALKSAVLSSSLQTQIAGLANEVKANRDTIISIVGHGDKLSAANQLNETLWAANFSLSLHRASAIESYLKQRLVAIGVRGYTISVKGSGTQTTSGFVVASIT
ncbi:MAG TPA: InlB B-repeat-containing protein [Acidimicrobiales bacterium]